MDYRFKLNAELMWVLLGAAAVAIATELIDFDPTGVDNWQIWVAGLAGVAIRAAVGAFLAVRSGGFVKSGEDVPAVVTPTTPATEPVPQGESLSIRASREKPYTLVVNGIEYVRADQVQR